MDVINCSECGVLFLKKTSSLMCPKCEYSQNKKIDDMIRYALLAQEPVPMGELIAKFDMSLDKFEKLFVARKFLKIADKLLIKCNSCREEVSAMGRNNFLCSTCANKIQKTCEVIQDDAINDY